jgi:hypothetical protein
MGQTGGDVERLWERIEGGILEELMGQDLHPYLSTGWDFPFLGGDLLDDLVRLIGWIDHMAVDDGMSASTVDTYISGAKAISLEQLVISDALGRRGEALHVWIQLIKC